MVDIQDLKAIAKLTDGIVLFTTKGLSSTENPIVVKVDFSKRKVSEPLGLQYHLKFTPYESVPDDKNDFFVNWLYRKVSNEEIMKLLGSFPDEEEATTKNIK